MKPKSIILLLFVLASTQQLLAQDSPTVAPKANAFNLGPNNLGAIANAVNLFSGELNLPLNLVSIPGGGGLGIDVSILYNSGNIENIVDTWSLDAPTGPLGLGWSMSVPSIVVDNKQTGARDDDDFYLLEGGSSVKLVCVGGSPKNYKAKTNPNWIITYSPASEAWTIIKEDGMRYFYGGSSSGRSTVQWVNKWGNWIGDSNNQTGKQQQGLVWNLAEVRNLWGDYILYHYTQKGEGSGFPQTEASYLYKITDRWGREVELAYGDKLAGEFMEPHTENGNDTNDGYQERYERKFLDKMYVRAGGLNFYEVRLGYTTNLLGTGNLTKRLLTSITKVAPNGDKLPPMSFGYLTSGLMRGALNQVTTQYGGTVTYEYHPTGLDLNYSQRDKNITAPSGYQEPRVFIENDYTVVTWRQLNGTTHDTTNERDVNVRAYTWDGQWRETNLGSIGAVKMSSTFDQDFKVATSKDCFAILRPVTGQTTYWLYIWHRDERVPGGWYAQQYNINLDAHDKTQERLLIGDNFVAVSNNQGKIFRYVYTGYSWAADVLIEGTPDPINLFNIHYTAATNNYIITQNHLTVKLHYLDEEKKWKVLNFGAGAGFSTSAETYWHLSNSFAIAMANGGNEFAFHWNQDYLFPQKINLGFGYPDNSQVLITPTLVTIVNPVANSNTGVRSIAYNGSNWIDAGHISAGNYYRVSLGGDYFLWEALPGTGKFKKYNPITSAWENEITYSYNPQTSINISEAGNQAFAIADKIYFRSTSGTWSNYTPSLPGSFVEDLLKFGNSFYVHELNGNTKFQFTRNSQLSSVVTVTGVFNSQYSISGNSPRISLLGGNTILTCLPWPELISITSFTIFRIGNEKLMGKHKDYPIIKVTTNDGAIPVHTSYDYNIARATIDPSGTSPMYNVVTTVPGSASVASKPNGYTETYFFNALTETELTETFPEDAVTNKATNNLKLLTGLPYRTKVFNSANALVSLSETYWNVNDVPTYNSSSALVDLAFAPRVDRSISSQDGIEVQSEMTYSAIKFQLKNQQIRTKNGAGFIEIVDQENVYAWEKYPTCVALNILSPVVQTSKKINGATYTESAVTRWKENWTAASGTVPAPYDTYSWKATGSVVFPAGAWNIATPPTSDWLFESRINSRETVLGRPLEQESRGGQLTSTLWSSTYAGPLAQVVNAAYSKVYYNSFENGSGNSTDARVGIGSYAGSYTAVIPSAGTYQLTYWRKPTGGSWELMKQTITANTSIGGAGYVIDEIRVIPASAAMTTSNYDVMGNVISVNDPNNISSHTEYDVFSRPTLSRDQDRNIVKHNFYRFKN